VAVHSPEFAHERDINNVSAYLKRKGINYPVAIDNDFAIWKRYSNRYWPAMYLIDKKGQLRYRHIGEGAYGQTEAMIRELLAES
ncbi:MAG: redoxin domain-containing protein, partial [Gammaproteobacteria bacterium]|nr:redoxin domain-containing protein [Gammaproteobacteria bacterium]